MSQNLSSRLFALLIAALACFAHTVQVGVGAPATTTPLPISGNAPESIENVIGFEIPEPTPPPAGLNGVYCRGGACQYRVPPPIPITMPPPTPFPNVVYGLNKREFCRGLGCMPLMGWPANANLDKFKLNCAHLFDYVAGGLRGTDGERKISDVRHSFLDWCVKRVGPLEVGACPAYADVVVAALAPSVDAPTVGGTSDVCGNMYMFSGWVNQAEVDLKLVESALPKGHSLLSVALNRFGTGGVGPRSPRGMRWREFAWRHRPAESDSLVQGGVIAPPLMMPGSGPSLVQSGLSAWGGSNSAQTANKAGAGCATAQEPDEDGPRGLPKYNPNPPCADGANVVNQKGTKYQIVPGSPDGAVAPVEIRGDLFTYCQNQMSEIMLGYSQTAKETVRMTQDWCSWQASVTSWVGQKNEVGHPDWKFETCVGMSNFVAYSLKDSLNSGAGLSSAKVCGKLFGALGAVHRVDSLIEDAWTLSLRAGPSLGMSVTVDDAVLKDLLAKTQDYANSLYGKLRGQKEAFEDVNKAKMDLKNWKPPVLPDETRTIPLPKDVAPPPGLLLHRAKRTKAEEMQEASENFVEEEAER